MRQFIAPYTRAREAPQEDKGVTKCDTLPRGANDKKDGERNVHPSIKGSRLILHARELAVKHRRNFTLISLTLRAHARELAFPPGASKMDTPSHYTRAREALQEDRQNYRNGIRGSAFHSTRTLSPICIFHPYYKNQYFSRKSRGSGLSPFRFSRG